MIHDTHLDNRVDVIKGSEKLAEQSGAMIGSVKQSKEVSTIALDSTLKACKCSVDFGVNMHRFSDIGAGTAYDVQSDVGRTENLTCNNPEVLNVVQELDTVNSDAGVSVEVKHMSKSKKQKTKQKKHKAKNIESGGDSDVVLNNSFSVRI